MKRSKEGFEAMRLSGGPMRLKACAGQSTSASSSSSIGWRDTGGALHLIGAWQLKARHDMENDARFSTALQCAILKNYVSDF
jgi:hypothetical protein